MTQKILLFIFLAFFCSNSFAQTSKELINQQDWITRQQQNKIEEDRRLEEQKTIAKERARKKKEEKEKEKINISEGASKCFPIKSISLISANSISRKQQKKLTSPFLNKCLDAKTLSEIITTIQAYYHEKGYITARAVTPKQNIQQGNLELEILEGKIDEIIINNNHLSDKMQGLTAFGFIEGDILNIKDINQGLYQINRLSSNNAAMKIEPSINDGEAKVYIDNQKKFPARASITHDNLGNKFTGINLTGFSGNLDNLLSLNDNINLSYSTNLNDDSKEKELKAFNSSISIPFGYNTFSYSYSHSEFKGSSQGISGISTTTGFSQRSNFSFDRVLFSEGNLRISANSSLSTKSAASYLNKSKQENSERKLTIANLGFTFSNYFKNSINLYLKPSYYKGLKILNAKQDNNEAPLDNAKAQFEYLKLYGSISKNLTIPKTSIPFSLSTEFDSQYSKDTLFGSEQFSVGGYYSVRGFRENYINGDSGYYLRNKANFNLGSLSAPLLKNNSSYLSKISFEPFYDYGYVKNKYADKGADGRLSGAGIKTIFRGKYFNASLTYSASTSHSRLISSETRENKMVYFELSANCCSM